MNLESRLTKLELQDLGPQFSCVLQQPDETHDQALQRAARLRAENPRIALIVVVRRFSEVARVFA